MTSNQANTFLDQAGLADLLAELEVVPEIVVPGEREHLRRELECDFPHGSSLSSLYYNGVPRELE